MKSNSCSQHQAALRATKWRTPVGGRRAFAPFYERHAVRGQTYSGLVHGWLVEPRAPHATCSESDPAAIASVGARDR